MPRFEGKVYWRGRADYEEHRYQYATSSFPANEMTPRAILYPAGEEDISKAILYASANGLALSVRTGGHQYSGASSTSGENIQLDLSECFQEFEPKGHGLYRIGVSWSLNDLNLKLGESGLFVPHGQCGHVHVGGHLHTGGYGSWIRSFGLFSDHVEEIEILCADGLKHTVGRHSTDPQDQGLFYAVLGGSPGNFGVVTHFTLRPQMDGADDDEASKARGIRLVEAYAPWKLQALLDILVEMAEDEELSADYELCITVMSSSNHLLPSLFPGIDELMAREHPELYGANHEGPFWPAVIIVFAQWANRHGSAYKPEWFQRIRESAEHGILHDLLPLQEFGLERSDDTPEHISKMTRDSVFDIVREFRLPYVKRLYLTNSKTLKQDGWSRWVVDRINVIEGARTGCKISAQFSHWGGKHSQMVQKNDGKTAYSWRKETSIVCILNCHYGAPGPFIVGNPRETAIRWSQINDQEALGPQGVFSKEDRRLFWSSYGDHDMSQVWPHYHESQQKYDHLVSIKQHWDPKGVFTPNPFCVGYAPPPIVPLLAPITPPPGVTPPFAGESMTYDEVMSKLLLSRHKLSREV